MHPARLIAALILWWPVGLAAQDLPPYVPVNPALSSRSPLYAQPYLLPGNPWRIRTVLDYSNAVEDSRGSGNREYVFDAETLQLDVWAVREIGKGSFAYVNLPLRGGYNGFLDGFLNWYHDLIGFRVPARNRRPLDTFEWSWQLPDTTFTRPRPGTFLGDVRLGGGHRFGRLQVTANVTLPTTTAGEGWGRDRVGASLAATANLLRTDRVVLDAGVTTGWTPTAGALARWQRSAFWGGLGAFRWRFAGQQAIFGTLWVQSPNWHDTGFDALDLKEVTLDFGFLLRPARSWPEVQLGMTEDLLPHGPAIDAGFKIGIRWGK